MDEMNIDDNPDENTVTQSHVNGCSTKRPRAVYAAVTIYILSGMLSLFIANYALYLFPLLFLYCAISFSIAISVYRCSNIGRIIAIYSPVFFISIFAVLFLLIKFHLDFIIGIIKFDWIYIFGIGFFYGIINLPAAILLSLPGVKAAYKVRHINVPEKRFW